MDKRATRKRLTSEVKAAIARAYLDEEKSSTEVAKQFDVHPSTVVGVVEATGGTVRDTSFTGSLDVDEHAFDDLSSDEALFWLGYLLARGTLHEGRVLIVRGPASHAKRLEELRKFLKAEHRVTKTKTAAKLTVTSFNLCSRLTTLGLVPRNPLLTIDAIPEVRSKAALWKGVIEGVGKVYSSSKVVVRGRERAPLLKRLVAFVAGLDPDEEGSAKVSRQKGGMVVVTLEGVGARKLLEAIGHRTVG